MDQILSIISNTNIISIAEYLRSFGIWAILVSILLNVIQTFGIFIPSLALSGANALVFGPFFGGVISWLGEVLGASLSFLAFRFIIKKPVQNKFMWLSHFQGKKAFYGVLITRLLPAVPSGAVNLIFATSSITMISFITATALGKIPSIFLEVYLAHDLIFIQENKLRLFFLLSIAVIITLTGRLFVKKYNK